MSSTRISRRVTVVGGGIVGLSTAIIIQENIPNVHVELVDDFGLTSMLLGRSIPNLTGATSQSAIRNRSDDIQSAYADGRSIAADFIKDGLNVGAASLLTQELSSTISLPRAWPLDDDVIWMPHSIPGIDDDTSERGGYLRFWAVLTWYHLYEMTQKESSMKTGVRLVSNYHHYQWTNKGVSDWWKDLLPGYTCHEVPQHDNKMESSSLYKTSFTTAMINVPRYVQYLTERFLRCGGKLTRGHISSINELSCPSELVVNCSGMNTSELNKKEVSPTDKAKHSPSMKASNFLDYLHIESETVTHKGRPLPVVHNYGYDKEELITLHWGCGQEACRLVSDIMARRYVGLSSKL
ncbi:uncharacterized protein LOC121410013 [Lytechinus variegatus]|uniref:uncharacterized protein LOC121410013 n=1 Tax=Lytechinus variegatus TaxID=7654 RepID=UPI001BB1B7A0|nr:uncharacterized protein LOC121410013 [Lytechinus variegatus]